MSEQNNPFPNDEHKSAEFTNADMTGTNFNGVNLTDATFWAVNEDKRHSSHRTT